VFFKSMNFKIFSWVYLLFITVSAILLFLSDRFLRSDVNNAEQIPATLLIFIIFGLVIFFTILWAVCLFVHFVRIKRHKK
jgi:hypothetical protein